MAKIEIPAFTGINKRAASHLLKPGEAVSANNCVVDSGAIVPLKWSSSSAATIPVGTKSVCYWNGAWQTSTLDRWYAESGQYLYWADGGTPQKVKVGGSAVRLGIVAPTAAPTGVDTSFWNYGPPSNGYVTPPEGWNIVYTHYSSTHGAESAPSPAYKTKKGLYILTAAMTDSATSITVDALDPTDYFDLDSMPNDGVAFMVDGEVIQTGPATQTVDTPTTRRYSFASLSRGLNGTPAASHSKGSLVRLLVPIAPTGLQTSADPQVTSNEVYYLSGGEYRKASSSSYTLDGPLLTADANDHPTNLTGLIGPYNGMLFGWIGKALRWTKVGQFDAWPEQYTFDDFPADITACALWGGFVVVFTSEGVYTVNGGDPEALSRFKVQGTRGTTAPRSIVNVGPGLLYCSNYGVDLFDGITSRSLSYDKLGDNVVMTNPRAAFLLGRAYIFNDGLSFNGDTPSTLGLICDIRNGDPVWTTCEVEAAFAYIKPSEDKMYLVSGTSLILWGSGGTMTWSYTTGLLGDPLDRKGSILTMIRTDSTGSVTITPYINDAVIPKTPGAFTVPLSGASRVSGRYRVKPQRGERTWLQMLGSGTLYGLTLEYQ